MMIVGRAADMAATSELILFRSTVEGTNAVSLNLKINIDIPPETDLVPWPPTTHVYAVYYFFITFYYY